MSEIDELQHRLSAAMDRVARAIEATPKPDDADIAGLKAELEEEKLANAQLQERVARLKAQRAAEDGAAEQTAARMSDLDRELQKLRRANEELRASNAKLREANAAGVGEPHLINKAMMAELEALRAARAADVAEASAILGALEPLLQGATEGQQTDA
ncbi:MAG: hypothetical protein AAFY38_02245 [Pseudomonadota bacterium]